MQRAAQLWAALSRIATAKAAILQKDPAGRAMRKGCESYVARVGVQTGCIPSK